MDHTPDQLLEALRVARLAYWEYDVLRDLFIFNDQFYSILRTTAQQEGGYTMSSAQYAKRFVHPEDMPLVGAEIEKALTTSAPHYSRELDHRIIYADGKIGHFAVHIRIEKDAAGRTVKTHGANVDITARKAAEEELRRTVSLLQSTFDSTADGLLVVDPAGAITWFNRRFAALWGIPLEILEKRDDEKALAHVLGQLRAPEQFVRKVKELYADPAAESFDVLDFKDGRIFERHSRPQLLDGIPIGRVWSFHDITEKRRLEADLRQAQKMDAFGQLAAGVAHDFNNILTVIQGNASLLGMAGLTRPEQEGARGEILLAAERAANLTRQLLTFSRRRVLQPKDLDLNEIVANMTKMLQRLLGEDIAQETHCAPDGAPVHADPGMIEQVLVNLAVNSRDAMPRGGRLVVRTATVRVEQAAGPSRPNARPGAYVRLSVSDTGTGIAAKDLPHVFEPFFTTKEVGKGTGLGLATVFGIVEQHQGWVEVESEWQRGTTFHVYLPRLAGPATPPAASAASAPPAGGTETILLVEDEGSVRDLLQALLERHGYRVHPAVSGADALEVWRKHGAAIDILVTDMLMPGGVSGRELAERLQAGKPGLKVLFCSGYTKEMFEKNSPLREDGNFLEKPFQVRTLLRKLREVADRKT